MAESMWSQRDINEKFNDIEQAMINEELEEEEVMTEWEQNFIINLGVELKDVDRDFSDKECAKIEEIHEKLLKEGYV